MAIFPPPEAAASPQAFPSPDAARAEIVVAGMNLVGLAFSAKGEMVVATNEAVYSLPLGIFGTLLD